MNKDGKDLMLPLEETIINSKTISMLDSKRWEVNALYFYFDKYECLQNILYLLFNI